METISSHSIIGQTGRGFSQNVIIYGCRDRFGPKTKLYIERISRLTQSTSLYNIYNFI